MPTITGTASAAARRLVVPVEDPIDVLLGAAQADADYVARRLTFGNPLNKPVREAAQDAARDVQLAIDQLGLEHEITADLRRARKQLKGVVSGRGGTTAPTASAQTAESLLFRALSTYLTPT